VLHGIFHGINPAERPQLGRKDIRGLLVAAEYKRMEKSSR